MWFNRVYLVLLALIGTVLFGSLVASGSSGRDECDPSAFQVRCGEVPGTRKVCVKVDGSDYLFGVGRRHYEVTAVSCPGAAPLCVEHVSGRGVCRAK